MQHRDVLGRSKITGWWAEETACPHAGMMLPDSFCAAVASIGAHLTPLLSLIVVKNWDLFKPGLDICFYILLSISRFYDIQVRVWKWNFKLITYLTWQEYDECLQRWIFWLAERYANIKIIEKNVFLLMECYAVSNGIVSCSQIQTWL